jgi:acyl carrier protein
MINLVEAQKRTKESLVGFPPRVTAAYLAFAEGGDLADLDIVVLGVLYFYLAKKPGEPLDTLPGATRLVEDLGCDSLTMMDTVFMAESLFDIKLDDGELARIATLDDLRHHLRQRVKPSVAPAA